MNEETEALNKIVRELREIRGYLGWIVIILFLLCSRYCHITDKIADKLIPSQHVSKSFTANRN